MAFPKKKQGRKKMYNECEMKRKQYKRNKKRRLEASEKKDCKILESNKIKKKKANAKPIIN